MSYTIEYEDNENDGFDSYASDGGYDVDYFTGTLDSADTQVTSWYDDTYGRMVLNDVTNLEKAGEAGTATHESVIYCSDVDDMTKALAAADEGKHVVGTYTITLGAPTW